MGVGVEAVQYFSESSPKDRTGTDCKTIIATAIQSSMKSCLEENSLLKYMYGREKGSTFSLDRYCRAVQIKQDQKGKNNNNIRAEWTWY